MKKVNIEEKTKAFNFVRQAHQNREFTNEELFNLLNENGIAMYIAKFLIQSGEIGKRKSASGTTYYSFRSEPLYKGKLEGFFTQTRKARKKEKPLTEEQKALNILKEKGYQVKKPTGFNLEKFSKDYPELYQKYSTYEIV